MISSTLRLVSLGTINITSAGVIIKDPITGLGNLATSIKDSSHNIKEGVWIGKRPLGFGISMYLLENEALNPLHYAFIIEGQAFHLTQAIGGGMAIQTLNESLQDYEWYYKGKRIVPKDQITALIEEVNKLYRNHVQIHLNSAQVAKIFVSYARDVESSESIVRQLTNTKGANGIIGNFKN